LFGFVPSINGKQRLPFIRTNTSFGAIYRRVAAGADAAGWRNPCPNRSHQARTVSWGDLDTTLDHQLVHIAEAEQEPASEPDAMADDLGREPETFVQRACSGHDLDLPDRHQGSST
jgi:hypothetical protein